jgi:hypothetical protein
MKVEMISETADSVVFSLEMTKSEVAICAAKTADVAIQLVTAVADVCRTTRAGSEEHSDIVTSAEVLTKATHKADIAAETPFKAVGYKGVLVKHAAIARNGLPPEEIMKEEILDKIIETNDIYLSKDQVDSETDYTLVSISQNLKYKAMIDGDYAAYETFNATADRDNIREQVVRRLKVDKILKSVVRQEHLVLTRDDLEDEAKAMAARQQTSIEMIERFFGRDFAMLETDLLLRKALDFLFDHAVIAKISE